jgi:hypothetical protein
MEDIQTANALAARTTSRCKSHTGNEAGVRAYAEWTHREKAKAGRLAREERLKSEHVELLRDRVAFRPFVERRAALLSQALRDEEYYEPPRSEILYEDSFLRRERAEGAAKQWEPQLETVHRTDPLTTRERH